MRMWDSYESSLYKGHLSDVWEISKTNIQPIWVQKAFKENYLRWNDDKLVISMSGINPSVKFNLKITLLSYPVLCIVSNRIYWRFLDITNHIALFQKNDFINIIRLLKKIHYNIAHL